MIKKKKKVSRRKREINPMDDMVSITKTAVGGTLAVTTLGVFGAAASSAIPKK